MTGATFTIAVDGPAASGKGTLSRLLARHFGLHYLDTGSLYRAVGLKALNVGADLADEQALAQIAASLEDEILQDPRLRDPGVGEAASKVAMLTRVRAALLDYQREFASRPPGAVLDGRDIATVVCPNAQVKLFVTASVKERAKRRHKELTGKNVNISFEEIEAEIERRDARDLSRSAAPLKKTEDAHLLDTTNLDIETAMNAAVHLVEKAMANQDLNQII